MEVHDGFIVGIFNYCDRWCERCAFTSHCRVFADLAKMEAALDPSLKAVADAPPRPEDVPPPPPAWMQELIAEANEACRNPPSSEEWTRMRPRIPSEHKAIDARKGVRHAHASVAQCDGERAAHATDLVWLGEVLERVRPNARAFVRPAFDEPEAVAKFLAGEGGR